MRISVPSYVIPGTWLENARFVLEHSHIRSMELLFFLYDDETRALIEPEWPGLRELGEHLGYTLHLPDSIRPEHEELVQKTQDLVSAYIVHPPREPNAMDSFAKLLATWQERYKTPFHLENTRCDLFLQAYDQLEQEALLRGRTFSQSICLDIGHLVMEGQDPQSWLRCFRENIAEIHLHGFNGHKDHVPFTGNEAWFKSIRDFLGNFDGIIELELFDWQQIQSCISQLEAL